MRLRPSPTDSSSSVDRRASHALQPRLRALALGITIGTLLSGPAFAGGADVSTDEIYSDGILLTDINGDGNVDLVVAANRSHEAGRSRYYLGNGDGTFGNGIRLLSGASSEIVVAEMNADTFPDLVQGRRDLTDLLYPGDGIGGFDVANPTDVHADALRVLDLVVGDLDNDGDLDIVVGTGRPGGVQGAELQVNRYYLNDGIGNFTGFDISADQDDTRGIALADMDGDSDLDVVVGNDQTTPEKNKVYLNQFVESGNATVSFGPGVEFGPDAPIDDQTSRVLVGDLNNDGMPDIVAINTVEAGFSPGIHRFFLNETNAGSFALSPPNDLSTDTDRSNGGVLADFDGDGDLDLAVANGIPTAEGESARTRLYLNQYVENGDGSVTFGPGLDVSSDEQMSRSIAAADLNGDGRIDLVVGNQDNFNDLPGHDRRYLNSGNPDNPFANIVPVIDAQADTLETDEQTDLTIVVEDVEVIDGDNVFPNDFTLTVQEGDNYTVVDNVVTPNEGFSGDLSVPVIVNDGTDDSDPFDLTVTVNDTINTPPQFTSTPVTVAVEGVAYTYNITTTDVDTDDVATIAEAAALPGWLTLTDNGDGTATLTGTPGAVDVGAANSVSLEASDGVDATPQLFDITVNAAGTGNNAPVFTSVAIVEATVGVEYSYAVQTEDPDGDDVNITAAPTLPDWLTLTDNGDGTATLVGTPDADDIGDHAVSLEVADDFVSTPQDFTITVAAATPGNNPPAFTSTAVTAATAGIAYSYDVAASDDDGDTLVITAETLPAWLTFTDDGGGTGSLTGTPDADDVGEHPVSLEVSDGTATVAQDFTITVAATPPVNAAPEFTSTAVVDALEGTTYTYDVTASDDDGDDLVITATTLPDWLELNDNGDGTAALTGTPAAADVGDHEVSLEVSDGTDTAVQDFTITVEEDSTVTPPPPPPSGGGGGGGSLGFFSLLALGTIGAIRRRRRNI